MQGCQSVEGGKMKGRSRRATWFVVAVAGLVLAGCGGPIGFYRSGPPRVPAGGTFAIEPGQDVVVYGVRAKRCGITPPDFQTALAEMFTGQGSQAPEVGEVYDAGIGQRTSVPCGGPVPVRAIGYRAPEGFEGEVAMVFYGADRATVTVALPEPEPEVEPEAEPVTATEPAPLADPDVLPPEGEQQPIPEGEAGPPEDVLPDSPLNN
jgi:hypothetical protein